MSKKVKWSSNTIEPDIKRPCICTGCKSCKYILSISHPSCETFGKLKCKECNEYRCQGCFCTELDICNYCARL